jgi:hypothetical protein
VPKPFLNLSDIRLVVESVRGGGVAMILDRLGSPVADRPCSTACAALFWACNSGQNDEDAKITPAK